MKQAVFQAQGHQYFVKEGDALKIDLLPGKKGDKIKFEEVLLFIEGEKVAVGNPLVKGAVIEGEILNQVKGKKERTFRFKAKSRYRKTKGFRALLTQVKILKITDGKK